MKAGWKSVPLKELCSDYKSAIVDGPFGSNLKREHFKEEGIPVLKIQNVKVHSINRKKLEYVSIEKAEELSRHSFVKGDIVMTKLGNPLGVSAIVSDIDQGIIVADLVRIRADKVNTRFLCLQLNSPDVQDAINKQQKGATRPRVKISMVRDLPISIPPLAEQKQIVSVLDQAFAGIERAAEAARKNRDNARELFETTLNASFTQIGEGWVETTLGSVADVRDGTHDSPKYVSEGIPFVTQKNIRHSGLCLENTKFISTEDHSKFYKRSNVAQGDILISMIGANRGMPCIVDEDIVFSIKNVGLIKICDDIDMPFLLMFLKSPAAKKYIESESRGGAQPFIGLTKLRAFPVSLPNLAVQKKVFAELGNLQSQTQRLEALYQQKLDALEELKQSLLQKAFAGELTSELTADFVADEAEPALAT